MQNYAFSCIMLELTTKHVFDYVNLSLSWFRMNQYFKNMKKKKIMHLQSLQQPFGCSVDSSSQFRTSRSLSATTCLFSPHSNHVQEEQP